jgi:hypothetical protein
VNGTGRKERDAAIVLRLPIRDWLAVTEDPTYPTVFQQLDTDPAEALVQQVWLDGGDDLDGYPAPVASTGTVLSNNRRV